MANTTPSKRTPTAPKANPLGKLVSLGPTEPWHVALLLPTGHDDFREPAGSAYELPEGAVAPIWLRLQSAPVTGHRKGIPVVTLGVLDPAGQSFQASAFGEHADWLAKLDGVTEGLFLVKAKTWADRLYLSLEELVDPWWLGRLRPAYPGKRSVINPLLARGIVLSHLRDAIPLAAQHLERELSALAPMPALLRELGANGWTLHELLSQAHLPAAPEYAQHSLLVLKRLAALGSMQRMHGTSQPRASNPVRLHSIDRLLEQLPHPPTGDQRRAVRTMAKAMATSAKPCTFLLTADVGVGKTYVAAVMLAAIADAGRRALLLSPNVLLAQQLHAEITGLFPGLPAALFTGSTVTEDTQHLPILIGTTALLHRPTGSAPFDLVIVDEQHRLAQAQREQHVGPGTHLLELSATPIPRTAALARYGRVHVIEMRETPKPKNFITRLYLGEEGARELFQSLSPVIRSGQPVLVVFPKREATTDDNAEPRRGRGGINDRYSVAEAAPRWEAAFPGLVRTLTSDDTDEAKAQVISDIKSGAALVLLSTSVVEVGINLPSLSHIAIVSPDRFGTMALHQLRGRTARLGGDGFCHLWIPEQIKAEAMDRLEFFAANPDGFVLADYELRRKGPGDLAPDSTRQSGADNSFLFGQPLELEALDAALPLWERLSP